MILPHVYTGIHYHIFIMRCFPQKDNDGIVMVNFFGAFINCTNPDGATLEQVTGMILHDADSLNLMTITLLCLCDEIKFKMMLHVPVIYNKKA